MILTGPIYSPINSGSSLVFSAYFYMELVSRFNPQPFDVEVEIDIKLDSSCNQPFLS